METVALIGFSTLAFLIIVQICVVAFTYGGIRQEVRDHGRRLGRIEDVLNGLMKKG